MRSLLLLLVLTGCGRWGFEEPNVLPDAEPDATDFPPPPTSFVPGTRLRPIVYSGNGVKQLVTWFDEQLDAECAISPAEDGTYRCMPTRVRKSFQYADAACTVPLLAYREPTNVSSCPSTTTYASFDIGDGRQRGVTLGPMFTGTLYQSNGTTCTMVGGALQEYYTVGNTVPLDTFVTAREIEIRHGNLSYLVYETDDGARELHQTELVDHVRGERCSLRTTALDRVLCMTKRPSVGRVFADPGCTEVAGLTNDVAGDEVYVYEGGLCEDTLRRFKLGAQLSSFYSLQNGTCTLGQIPAGYTAYRLASELPLDPSATGTLVRPTTTDILGEARWAFDNGMELPAGLWDTRHDDFCTVLPMMTTFTTVCAPLWTGAWTVYSEDTCTTAKSVYPECRGKWRSTWYPSANGDVPCDLTFTNFVHQYNLPVAGPFWRKVDQTCTPVTEVTGAAFAQATTRSAESEFAPVVRQME